MAMQSRRVFSTSSMLVLLWFLSGNCNSSRAEFVLNLAPEGSIQSQAIGVHGNTVVGNYFLSGREGALGFTFDIATGSRFTLDMPGTRVTDPQAIFAGRIVGQNEAHSFLYTGGVFTEIMVPGSPSTRATSVSANRIGGNSAIVVPGNVAREVGFIFDGSNYTTVEPPNSRRTVVTGITDRLVVGTYEKSSGPQIGFVFDGTTYADILPVLDNPSGQHTSIFGIDGNNVIGHQGGLGGFVFDGSQFRILEEGYIPVAIDRNSLTGIADNLNGFLFANGTYSFINAAGNGTRPFDVYGTDVVGFYFDNMNNGVNSFLFRGENTAVPEPSSLVLCTISLFPAFVVLRRRHLTC